jgi:hypothetical protein
MQKGTYYDDTSGWKLVNDFTIQEPERMSDRPFMLTCVPQLIIVEAKNIKLVEEIRFDGQYADNRIIDEKSQDLKSNTSKYKAGFSLHFKIKCEGFSKDNIVVFEISNGAVAKFNSFKEITIQPIDEGIVGGAKNSSVSDGLSFSGMSSKIVPPDGLMAEEPGRLFYFEKTENILEEDGLYLELFINRSEFIDFYDSVKSEISKLESLQLHLAAELFENEVSASLSEPWHRREYGLLKKSGGHAYTRVRLDNLYAQFGNTKKVELPKSEQELLPQKSLLDAADFNDKKGKTPDYLLQSESLKNVDLENSIKKISRTTKFILFFVVILLLTLIFKR